MAKLLNLEGIEYILKDDLALPKEEQTIWHIRPLKLKERAEVQDGAIVTELDFAGPKNGVGKGIMRHLSGTQQKLALTYGLVKIENLKDSEGKAVQFSPETKATEKEKVLDRIPPEWTKEITDKILLISGLTKEEEKN